MLVLLFLVFSASLAAVSQPTQLWAYGGCFNSWCHTGWYSSPAIANINGVKAVIGGFYSFWAVKGTDGKTIWQNDVTSGVRMWPGIIVTDLDNDGNQEVVTAHGGGRVGVWKLTDGTAWNANWPKTIDSNEFRSIAVADIDNDGSSKEIVIGKAASTTKNVWVLNADGSIRSGWPRVSGSDAVAEGCYSWGVYSNNIGITNMDADSALEIIVPSDVSYVCAYKKSGSPMNVKTGISPKSWWGLVQFSTNQTFEPMGYIDCATAIKNPSRTNFAEGPVVIADLDGDNVEELIFTGRTYTFCESGGTEMTTHNGIYVTRKDRSRYVGSGYDWNQPPAGGTLGPRLSSDYNEIESANYAPAVADIDGDGKKEILFSGYDGKIHCFWLDKTEKHNWPVVVGTMNAKAFATEPVIVDFDNDGKAEIVVSVWYTKTSNKYGDLLVLDYQGTILYRVPLPYPRGCYTNPASCTGWGGALATPTIGNINDDANMEIVLVTVSAGIVAFTVPNSANARLLWETSRGNQHSRNGVYIEKNVAPPPTPVNCVVSAPRVTGPCDKPCGPGRQPYAIDIVTPAKNGGTACPTVLTGYQDCNLGACPVNCVVSAPRTTGPCDKSCGPGRQPYAIDITTPAANGGTPCPTVLTGYQDCNLGACPEPANCVLSQPRPTGACDKSCGPGKQPTIMDVLTPAKNGGTCPSVLTGTQDCNLGPCPEPCQLGEPRPSGECSVLCGGGIQTTIRDITVPAKNGGYCPSEAERSSTQSCNPNPCSKDCELGAPQPTSECDKPCGTGSQTTLRPITVPAQNGGSCPSEDDRKGSQPCNTQACPSNPGYIGCYSAVSVANPAEQWKSYEKMSKSACAGFCAGLGKAVYALQSASSCFCYGQAIAGTKVADSDCNEQCLGNVGQLCGGQQALAIYNNGPGNLRVGNDDADNDDGRHRESTPSELNGGHIAGIVIGAVAVVVIAALMVYIVATRRRSGNPERI